MKYIRLTKAEMGELKLLQTAYKREIGEQAPMDADFIRLQNALEDGSILFYGCTDVGKLVACCSVSPLFSTFNYQMGGVFEDFYIVPDYRHKGIARQLVRFAYQESGVCSLTVGCAPCDADMYRAIGFTLPLGNMLAYDC